MGMSLALISAALLGSATIVALSRHLALSDSARDFTPPSLHRNRRRAVSDDFERVQRGHSHGLMVAGYSGVTHAVRSLCAALLYVEFASRGGIPTTGPVMSMVQVEAGLREILARVEALNARHPAETREAA